MMVRGEAAHIMGNARMLDEMIYNLCDNAIRYNKPGGHVWLTTGVDIRNRAYIEVKDDGIGIPEIRGERVGGKALENAESNHLHPQTLLGEGKGRQNALTDLSSETD